jgi:hypothetical protein
MSQTDCRRVSLFLASCELQAPRACSSWRRMATPHSFGTESRWPTVAPVGKRFSAAHDFTDSRRAQWLVLGVITPKPDAFEFGNTHYDRCSDSCTAGGDLSAR